MQQTKATHTTFERVLEEHRELREAVAGLRELCAGQRRGSEAGNASAWASELAQRLVGLHQRTRRHFHEEERSRFLEELCESFPPATRSAAVIRNEHRVLLARLRSVLDAALGYAESSARDRRRLRRRTLTLLDALERHEREETDLIQRIVNSDLGCVD